MYETLGLIFKHCSISLVAIVTISPLTPIS
jgi:hypothetical protein